jgi:hypothetical protein
MGRSEHFTYYQRAGDEVCPSALDEMEDHLAAVRSVLPLPKPRPGSLKYYKYGSPSDFAASSPCSESFGGCAVGREQSVHSLAPASGHELVHVYMSLVKKEGVHPLFAEGVAELFGCDRSSPDSPNLSFDDALALAERYYALSSGEYDQLYLSATYLVRWILREHGPTKFLELYRTSTQSRSAFRRHLQAHLGRPAEDVWREAMKPIGTWESLYLCPCGAAGIGVDGGVKSFGRSCTVGLRDAPFEISGDATLAFSTPLDPGPHSSSLRFAVRSCDGRGPDLGQFSPLPDRTSSVGLTALPRGRYYVRRLQGQGDLELKSGSWLTRTCGEALAAFKPGPSVGRLSVSFVPNEPRFAALELDEPWYASPSLSSQVELCTACPAPGAESCGPILEERELPPGRVLLRFPGSPSGAHVYFSKIVADSQDAGKAP